MSFLRSSRSSLHLFIVLLCLVLKFGVADAVSVQQALGYVPSQTAAVVASVLYIVFAILLFVNLFRYKDWWGSCLSIGALGSALGFITRYFLAKPEHQNSKRILIAEEILVLCSPAAFLAFNYIVYGRLVQNCIGARHGLIRPSWVSAFFVLSDIITFIIQAGGAALELQPDHLATGETVVNVGVGLQTVSFFIFCGLTLWTWWSIKREKFASGREVWWKAYMVLTFSSAFMLIRAIYRMVSSLEGRTSTLSTQEICLYLLDVLPLMIAIGIYVPFWPGRYIDGKDSIVSMMHEELKSTTPSRQSA